MKGSFNNVVNSWGISPRFQYKEDIIEEIPGPGYYNTK